MSAHASVEGSNKITAIIIAVLAALLAVVETAANNAQQRALSRHIEAANLWAFFQAKTIRQTAVRTMSEASEFLIPEGASPERIAAYRKRVDAWKATIERWESEPDTQEGRKELVARAKAAEAARDLANSAHHQFEFASAGVQLAIVLVSSSIVTGARILLYLGVGLGVLGGALGALGWLAPTIHLF